MFRSVSAHREVVPFPRTRGLRTVLLASASVILFSTASLAGDGDGGRGGWTGTAYGGTSSLTGTGNPGLNGGLDSGFAGGGGGGGSGVTGGAGGTGYGASGGAGGAGAPAATTSGGVVSGANGTDGVSATTNDMGGGGGGGASHAYSGDLTNLTGTTYIGGTGGAGGSALANATGGGGGGGGFGAVLTGLTGGSVTLSATSFTGGAGGASGPGARGGSGGTGLYIDSPTGSNHLTIGATLTGGAGGSADAFGGGGGTAFALWNATGANTVDINGAVHGGTGGAASDMQVAIVHGGGFGGYGIVIGGSPNTILNVNADVIAGDGGAGVDHGGDGGVAIYADDTTINVNGGVSGVVIQGGNSGAGPAQGIGGQGITGGGLNITLTGRVTVIGGGSSPSIEFYGSNSLTLVAEPGSGNAPTLLNGVVHDGGGTDSLTLSGTGTGTLATAVTNGFTSVTKSGTGTWTLTGSSDQSVTQWTISGGTLSVSRPVFGPSAALTLSGGTLEITQTVPLSTAISVTDASGLSAADGTTLTLNGALSGSGAITKSGAGTLKLVNANSAYTGDVTVSAGTLALNGSGSLANAASLTLGTGTTLDISGTTSGATVRNLSSTDASATVLLGSQTLTVNATATSVFSGVISGSGGLNVTSNGGLILAGNNTYTGTTTVSGSLLIGYLSASGSVAGNITVNAGGTLAFGRSDTYSIQNSIAAAAGSTVGFGGGGQYSYAGAGVISGDVRVAGGGLRLLGSEFASASSLSIESGGTLSGNGTVTDLSIGNGGTIAPGNSPGTIHVVGTVSFDSGSTYRVDVTPGGAHDLITATGAVTINNGAAVQVVAQPGRYAPNSSYAILTTTGTVTGTFGSVTSDYAFLTPSLSYDAQNVYLVLDYSGGVSFATFAQTPNQAATATAAQALGAGNAVFDALVQQTASSAPAAFNALSGEAYASTGTVIQQQAIYVRDAVGSRLMQSLTAPGVSPLAYGAGPQTAALGEGLTPTLWAQGYGGWGNSFSNGNAASISNSIGGFLIGADVALAPNVRAGLFGGFSQSQFDVADRSSTGSMNNVDLGLYVGAQFGAVALRGGASYTWHDVSTNRTVAFPGFSQAVEGGYNTGTTQVFGELGYDFAVGAYAFEPFAGLAYVNVAGASLQESGGSTGLSVSTSGMSTTYSTLGLRVATTLQAWGSTLTPHATVGWQHAFGDTTPTSTMQFLGGATPFSVSGVPIAEDAVLLQAGLSYALSSKATLGASYTSQLASTAAQNAFTAQFSLKF